MPLRWASGVCRTAQSLEVGAIDAGPALRDLHDGGGDVVGAAGPPSRPRHEEAQPELDRATATTSRSRGWFADRGRGGPGRPGRHAGDTAGLQRFRLQRPEVQLIEDVLAGEAVEPAWTSVSGAGKAVQGRMVPGGREQ